MATNMKLVNSVIKLRRDNDYNYDKVKDTFIPFRGEVCLIDTDNYGLRIKIGDGVSSYNQLNFLDQDNNIILIGYLFNNIFYTDSTYTIELEKNQKHLYLDKNSNSALYIWTGESYQPVSPEATETLAGIMKLYQTQGKNIDGTMSQKIITNGINSIKFQLDNEIDECLILDKPWEE